MCSAYWLLLLVSGSQESYVKLAVEACQKIHAEDTDTDSGILVFLPSSKDIRQAVRLLMSSASTPNKGPRIHALPLYSALDQEEQALAQDPPPLNCRKVICATNIAETSITLKGVRSRLLW